MPKTKVYEPEFKKKIVQLYLEEGRTIKSLNEEFQLGDGTVRKCLTISIQCTKECRPEQGHKDQ